MNKVKRYIAIGLLSFFAFLAVPQMSYSQCPMCKAAVESGHGEEPNPLADGLNTGILYLFVLPYLSFGVIGVVFYIRYRRKKQRELDDQLHAEQQSKLPGNLGLDG